EPQLDLHRRRDHVQASGIQDRCPPCPSPSHHASRSRMSGAFLTAAWRHVAILNYEIDRSVLAALVPRGTELDEWQGHTYLSVVGFLFLRTKVLGLPIPFHRNFEE